MLDPFATARVLFISLLQAYQTSYSYSLEYYIVSTLEELWLAHGEVAHPMRKHFSEGYEELSSALVQASQGILLRAALGSDEQKELPLALPGRMVAAVVTAEQAWLPAGWHGSRWGWASTVANA